MNPPQLQHRTSSDSHSEGLDFLQEADLYDAEGLQDWKQEQYFNDPSMVPSYSSGEHEKHFLPQLDREESENKRQEIAQDSGKKKPGRKPILNEPTTKRKAQNRAAQRAFRERKENHVKELETRVHELEQQNMTKSSENEYLKAEIARLQGGAFDANFARNEDFTFAFASPVSLRQQSTSSASGISPSAEFLNRPSDCPSLSSSHTSPQSVIEGDFNAAAMPFFARQERTPSLHKSDTAFSTSSQSSSSFRRSSGPSLLQLQAAQPQVSQIFSDPYTVSDGNKTFSFDPTGYRDNSIFDNYDDPTLFDTSSGFIDPLQVNSQLDMYLPIDGKTDVVEPSSITSVQSDQLEDWQIAQASHNVGCEEVWRKITAHPKFPIFDLDDLCSEFKSKATCSQKMKWTEVDQKKGWEEFDERLDQFAAKQEQKLIA